MKKLNIRFLKHPGKFRLAYFPGEMALFEEKQAREMHKAGVVELLDESDGSDLPADLPGRNAILKAGISFEELQKIENFEEIKGVAKPTAQKLTEYFKTKK